MLIDKKGKATKKEKEHWKFKLKSVVASFGLFIFVAIVAFSFGQVPGCNKSGVAKNALATVNGIDIYNNNPTYVFNYKQVEKFQPKMPHSQKALFALRRTIQHYLLCAAAEKNKINVNKKLHMALLLNELKRRKITRKQFGSYSRTYRLFVEKDIKQNYQKQAVMTDITTAARTTALQLQLSKTLSALRAAATIVTVDLSSAKDDAAKKALKSKIDTLYKNTKSGRANFAATAAQLGLKPVRTGLFGFLEAPAKKGPLYYLQGDEKFHSLLFTMKKGEVSAPLNLNGTLVIFQVLETRILKDKYEKYLKDRKLLAKLPKKTQEAIKKQQITIIKNLKQNARYNIMDDWFRQIRQQYDTQIDYRKFK